MTKKLCNFLTITDRRDSQTAINRPTDGREGSQDTYSSNKEVHIYCCVLFSDDINSLTEIGQFPSFRMFFIIEKYIYICTYIYIIPGKNLKNNGNQKNLLYICIYMCV